MLLGAGGYLGFGFPICYIHAHPFICTIYLCIYTYIRVREKTHIYIYTYLYVHASTYVHICIYIHIYACIYIYICVDTHFYTHKHTYVYVYIYPKAYIHKAPLLDPFWGPLLDPFWGPSNTRCCCGRWTCLSPLSDALPRGRHWCWPQRGSELSF